MANYKRQACSVVGAVQQEIPEPGFDPLEFGALGEKPQAAMTCAASDHPLGCAPFLRLLALLAM